MENQWPVPPTDPQYHHGIPPTTDRPGPAFQPNVPTYQRGEDNIVQNCSCPRCSEVQHTQAGPSTWYPVEQQDPRHFGNVGAPYHVNQDQDVVDNRDTTMIAPAHLRAQFAPPNTGLAQDNYVPGQERAGPSNIGLLQAPTLDTSIAESRRRLASRYLNNADAHVSMIRLEPGASGQFQVIITLEMINAS
ncbi:hypothetical protein EDB84DRAFT_1495535 [Lactarius hengduanensis]|nr:hypothetical protein EDB84DRAFT_1495535 [Lactarius hengduanensis]